MYRTGLQWAFCMGLGLTGAVSAAPVALDMEEGSTRVLPAAGVTRIAVGSGQVAQALAVDGKEVVVFARKEGSSSLHIWTRSGAVKAYSLQVRPAGFGRIRAEVEQLLAGLPQLRLSVVGRHLVIEGSSLSDQDKARVAAMAARYTEVLDLTGDVGWEQMVLLDVQVVELPRARLLEFGMRWSSTPMEGAVAQLGGRWAGLQLQGVRAALDARLQALAQTGEAVFLARPRLLARSGSPATFLAGGELPYVTADDSGRGTTVFKPYGVALTITPRIDPRGTIRSRIEVESSSIDATVTVPAGPAMRTRRASTEFNVPSGQTLVLGGFLGREQTRQRRGLPWLSRIPILGLLFGEQREQTQETELLIIVTPYLVGPQEPALQRQIARGQAAVRQAFPEPPRLFEDPEAPAALADWAQPGSAASQWAPAQARPAALPPAHATLGHTEP
ncbi:secretion protein [Bordetella trematum]|uniref:Type IV pilus biogenesis and competence protein PilQ n=1 Tax=Bordetella trematum TaxID=123899 RepID=A0A157SUA6_9BORD|nr:pilus assembly protein N-terminal domain-containing protein [Bordetella trematum]AZR94670.1 secretion protein [Bordetella trematum]NNH19423.1 secretion protein [Bordetella trematum]QIM73670.1 secretion protein [Bordetella trematum]SAH99816.1 pilus assembly protein [Bordetella trematum]SAI74038.1 pilus assembly protein [Bordetella trematum]